MIVGTTNIKGYCFIENLGMVPVLVFVSFILLPLIASVSNPNLIFIASAFGTRGLNNTNGGSPLWVWRHPVEPVEGDNTSYQVWKLWLLSGETLLPCYYNSWREIASFVDLCK